MNNLNTKMDHLTNLIKGSSPEETITQEQTQNAEASNPLHGAPGVWNHEF